MAAGPWRGKGQDAFELRTQALQEELGRLFAPYHRFCPDCGSQCCREPAVPYSEIDAILYGRQVAASIGSPAAVPEKIGALRRCFRSRYLERKLRQFTGPEGDSAALAPAGSWTDARLSHCPALGASGCTLPWGRRPAICVFCACPRFLIEMGRRDYRRYLWVNIKYLLQLTRALLASRFAGGAANCANCH